jgi:hypothetical protein
LKKAIKKGRQKKTRKYRPLQMMIKLANKNKVLLIYRVRKKCLLRKHPVKKYRVND